MSNTVPNIMRIPNHYTMAGANGEFIHAHPILTGRVEQPAVPRVPTNTPVASRSPSPVGETPPDHNAVDRFARQLEAQLANIAPLFPSADAGDESLQRYKQSLGLGGGKDLSDPSDSRVCIIQSLTMESPGRGPVTIDLQTPGSEQTLKDKPFKVKEGAKFTMVASFKVQHEILSGLHYVQIVKRKGIRVSKDSEMIVRNPSE
jgi:hypothetical protein